MGHQVRAGQFAPMSMRGLSPPAASKGQQQSHELFALLWHHPCRPSPLALQMSHKGPIMALLLVVALASWAGGEGFVG